MWNEYSVLNDYSELYLEAAIAFVRDRGLLWRLWRG